MYVRMARTVRDRVIVNCAPFVNQAVFIEFVSQVKLNRCGV
jgi:hypothetical protein